MTAQRPEPRDTVLVEREEVAVMYQVTDDNPKAMGRAWAELEAVLACLAAELPIRLMHQS